MNAKPFKLLTREGRRKSVEWMVSREWHTRTNLTGTKGGRGESIGVFLLLGFGVINQPNNSPAKQGGNGKERKKEGGGLATEM
jgi:hypothetical protein